MRGINDRLRVGMDVAAARTTSSAPVMIGRQWQSGQFGEQTYVIPEGTAYIVARGIGAGGAHSGGSAANANAGGGGGAFVKAIFPATSSDTLTYVSGHSISVYSYAMVKLNATIIFLANGGGTINAANGAGGTVTSASQYVTVTRSGSAGTSSQGGAPGNDLVDLDTLFLTGTGATTVAPASGFGAGACCVVTGVGTATTYPQTDGVVVLEFWTGDPR